MSRREPRGPLARLDELGFLRIRTLWHVDVRVSIPQQSGQLTFQFMGFEAVISRPHPHSASDPKDGNGVNTGEEW